MNNHQIGHLTRFGYMEQTDGETAALTSPEDIKRQMKVAIADFQAGPHCVNLPSVLKLFVVSRKSFNQKELINTLT